MTKKIWILSASLLLILLICSMYKTPVSEFNNSHASQLVLIDFSISKGCFANTLIFYDQQTLKQNNKLNIDKQHPLWRYIRSNSEGISSSFYIPQILIWARWIWLPRRRPQPYRNPQRRFRLNKKQRRGLRRRLSNFLEQENTLCTFNGLSSSLELV